jgi:hypothetical protein
VGCGEKLLRQIMTGGGAREQQRAEQQRELGHGRAARVCSILAGLERAEDAKQRLGAFQIRRAHRRLRTLAGDIGRECGGRAGASRAVARSSGKKGFDQRCARSRCIRRTGNAPLPALHRLLEGRAAGARGERLLRFEMAIEATMGQAGRCHQVGDTQAIDAAFADQARSSLGDRGAVGISLLAGNTGHALHLAGNAGVSGS